MLFDFGGVTPASVAADTESAIAEAETVVSRLLAVDGPRTFENTMRPLEDISSIMSDLYGRGPFLAHASPDPDVLEAARASQETHAQWMSDLAYRDDMFAAVATFATTAEARNLTGESARLLDHTMRTFRMAGHELPPDARQELREINKRLIELGVAFSNNLADYQDYLVVTRRDLDGLPESYIEQLKPGEKKSTYCVSMDYPDVIPFMESATVRERRRELSKKFNSRAVAQNRPLLEETVQLRRRVADIFGLPSWAHWSMQEKMAKTPEAVDEMYAGLQSPLSTAAEAEVAKMAAMLEKDEGDSVLQRWDSSYYENLIREREFGVYSEQVAEYFSLKQCVDGMLTITGDVFGLDYEQINETNAWHDDVMLYRIADRASGDHLAYFYMDLFPREGKFGHAAAFDLVHAKYQNGENIRPVSAILANFTKPSADRPSLLKHDEVLTLFHEFGHILHMSLAQTEFTDFSGAHTEWDFVEAPSQIMEHWCWKPEVLATFAYHFETGEPIPAETIDQLAAARNLNVAIRTLGQIAYGTLDMALHGTAAMSLDDALQAATDVSVFPLQEGTFFPASFGHLYGYDAGYYGYLWSEVFGDDMFSEFESAGVTNPEIGMHYRKTILEPNGSRDAVDLLDDFLGRPPSNKAFLKKLGIKA